MEPSETVTNKAFIINMINSCIGVGLLAKPYALIISGWYSIISVTLAFSFITYTGYIFSEVTFKAFDLEMKQLPIATNYQRLDDMESSPPTTSDGEQKTNMKKNTHKAKSIFQILGHESMGKYGEYYVITSVLLILLLVCTSLLIIEFQLLSEILNTDKYTFIYIILLTFPMIFILNWKQLTFVGYISVTSIIIIVSTILVVFIVCMATFNGNAVPDKYFENDNDDENSAKYAIESMSIIQRIFLSFITFKSAIAGTFAIPPLIMSLKDKSWRNIRNLIIISYGIVTIFCITFGAFGALIYDENTNVLILNNLFIWPSGVVVTIIAAIKIINLWSSFGILLSIITYNLKSVVLKKSENAENGEGKISKSKQYLIRFGVLAFTSIIAYLFRFHLAFIISIQGTVSSLFGGATMLPLILYIFMFWSEMTLFKRLFHCLLLLLVICIGIIVINGSSSLV